MILKRISILNYKNLEQVELNFSAKLNCFFGQNGMGKTNLLDAVYFLSFCKSAGNPIDSQNIRHEQDFFVIQGFYEAMDGTPEEIYCGMKRRSKKQFKRNKKEYSRLSDHIGFIPLVMVSPADSELIAGGSDERRRFMDVIIIIGCVIKGDTPHFDYVCMGVTQGVAQLNATGDIPVIYGLITTNTMEQAEDRAGGKLGNKGDECAITAIKMIDFVWSLNK
jgi:6,7-dimethyl-8-ribityllumazine synthase